MEMCAKRKAGKRQRARRRFACRPYPSHGPLRFITSRSPLLPCEKWSAWGGRGCCYFMFTCNVTIQTRWLGMDNGHWKCYSKNINHLYFTFNEKDVLIILHCLGEPFDVTLSVCVRLGASMTKAFWTKQGTVAWHIAVWFAIFLQRAAHKLAIFSTSETRAEKVDCERSLFFFRFSKGNARTPARVLSGEAARREKRGRQPISRLAPSVTRVVICVSGAFCSTDQEKRETARSLPKKRLLKTTFCHSFIRFVVKQVEKRPPFWGFISSIRSFIACDIPDRQSRVQIGFDQISPLGRERDLGTRLLSPKGYDWYTVNPLLSPQEWGGGLFISNLC